MSLTEPQRGPDKQSLLYSLRTKVVSFLLLVLIGTLLIILGNTWLYYQSLQRKIAQDALYMATRATASAERIVEAQVAHLQFLARLAHGNSFNEAECMHDVFGFLRDQTRYLTMGLASLDGTISCIGTRSGDVVPDITDRDWFQAIRNGRESVYQVAYGKLSRRPVLISALRVDMPGTSSMVVFSSIDLSWLSSVLRLEATDTDNVILQMLDTTGRIVAHTGIVGDPDLSQRASTLWDAVARGETHVTAPDIDGMMRDFNIMPIILSGRTTFHMLAGIDSATAANQAFSLLRTLIGPYLVFTILVVALGFFFAERGLHQPIKAILASVGRYASGDRAARIGPPYLRSEIGLLGRALDQLADAVELQTAELQRSERKTATVLARTEALIAASPVPIVLLAHDLRALFWNPAAEKVYGFMAEEVVGRVPPIIPPDDLPAAQAYLDRVFRGESLTVDLHRLHRDGRLLEVRASFAPMRDENGQIDGAVVIFQDETDRRMAERQFAQAQKTEALGQLTGGLSHDFNNLLGVVIGNMDFILDEVGDNPKLKGYADSALTAALQGAELNKRLLAYARRQPLAPEVVRLGEEIGNILSLLKRTLGEHITVRSKVEADIWPVLVDPSQLQASIVNLGVNARDAMPNGGILDVEVFNKILDAESLQEDGTKIPRGRYVVVCVSDTGTGMPPEVLKRIFEPFYTTKEVGKGTGLGLSMVYGFVKQSGGHITCYSEYGKGTTFRLYLPYADGAPEAKEISAENGGMALAKEVTVLLVEDNADLRQVANQQLQQIGCKVIEAIDAASGLAILHSDAKIDMILSDIVMPGGMDGRQLAAEAMRLRPDIKILLMSGYSDPRMKRGDDGRTDGDWPLLTKPFRRSELLNAMLDLLPGLKAG